MSLLRSRRTAYYLGLVAVTTVFFTLLYAYGMATWEGRPRPWYQALEIVFQSFTTTGYGQDAGWDTPQMNVLVITMQLTGIGLILTAVDVFAVPWLQRALEESLPTAAPDADDHVILCTYSSRGEAFLDELDSRGRDAVVLEPDEARARDLHDAGRTVVHGDPESIDVLRDAGIERAAALVSDAADDSSASIVLTAREAVSDIEVVTIVDDASVAHYHRIAGADAVLSPRQLLGESLAHHVPTSVTTVVEDGVELGDDLELIELSIDPGSDLCNRRAGEVELGDRFAVDVVGAWIGGSFESPIPPSVELDEDVRLLVAGAPDRIAVLREEATSTIRSLAGRRVLVAGYGDAGAAAAAELAETAAAVTVIDREAGPAVDVVGDTREPDVFREAGVTDASAVIVAVNDDTTAIFTTLVVAELNPEAEVLVRANDPESEPKLYRAGADYVQSLATVSGRMLASTVLDDETVLTFDTRIDLVRLPAGRLSGSTVVDADVRAETGCTVLAVVRDGEMITSFDSASFALEPADEVVLAGTDESVRRFEATFLAE
ncbi:TrkA-N domain-containing protein [Halovivax asiaticus JCM 14624]|uniref:TrkA-N domain-containing protein n=1 Tax=Halovivax asiaticus JCM 14624 TaxID=1227490 RepID=M0BK94_9EURY|nr:NAD-binding protein [Halovivax asiaticus]ELZ10728.1 TrkA-N domain-containing protein [Halovivax asiaticus JCM 14624]